MDDVVARRETSVQVLIDSTAPNTANYATAHVVGFTQSMAAEVLHRNLARLSSGSLNFQRVGLETVWPHMLALVGLGAGIVTTTVLVLRRHLTGKSGCTKMNGCSVR